MSALRSRLPTPTPRQQSILAIGGYVAVAVVVIAVVPGTGAKIGGLIFSTVVAGVIERSRRRLALENGLSRYREKVERKPLSLFDEPPQIEGKDEGKELDSRSRLMDAVIAEIDVQRKRGDPEPVLVVGEAGSGKTTFAAGLARAFARANMTPVVLPLRNAGKQIDFRNLARDRFLAVVGDGGADLWSRATANRTCVVIADGLDERDALPVGPETGRILDAAAARGVPVVVTSRPTGLPSERGDGAIALSDLPEGEAAGALMEASRNRLPDTTARRLTRHLGLTSQPLFLQVARDLAADCATPAETGPEASSLTACLATSDGDLARVELLDGRLDTFVAERPGTRRLAVETVSVVALIAMRARETAGSVREQKDPDTEAWLQQVAGPPGDRIDAIQPAYKLTFVDPQDGGLVRFRHPIIHSYLVARALELVTPLPANGTVWASLLKASANDEVLRTVRMHAMRLVLHRPPEDAEQVIRNLVAELQESAGRESRTVDQRLSLLATAAHALGSAAAAWPDALEAEREALAQRIVAGWDDWDPDAALDSKRIAIKCVARMAGDFAFESVWTIARKETARKDETYDFNWAVVEAMAEGGAAAADALEATVRPMLDSCVRWAEDPSSTDDDLSEAVLRPLAVVAKFLPSGCHAAVDTASGRVGSDAAARLTVALASVVRAMAKRKRALGVEASLAQGLKQAAFRYPLSDINLAHAEELVRDACFWYSRIMALHALVRHAVAVDDTRSEAAQVEQVTECISAVVRDALRDRHPWVREAAAQAGMALDRLRQHKPDDARAFVWHDEAAQVARASDELAEPTSQLLADVALVLNMNEQGGHEMEVDGHSVRHSTDRGNVPGCATCDHQLAVGLETALPHCVSEDGDRRRILRGGCDCKFRLCPYDFVGRDTLHAHRGPLSAAFCANQRAIAKSTRRTPPWQPQMSLDDYVAFWEAFERARLG